MVMCLIQDSEGYLLLDGATSLENCPDTSFIVLQKSDYVQFLNYSEITAGEITEAFGFGFAAVFVTGWASTYGVKIALKLISLL
jgi:hypothetical protein